MQYLIVRCDELGDQWECDCDRTPIQLTEDWKEWYKTNKPDYRFEVYKYENNEFEIIKDYETSMEEGMALYYWEEDEDDLAAPHVVKKWPNRTREDSIPKEVLRFKKFFEEDYKLYLKCGGAFSYSKDNRLYVYGEYRDSIYSKAW